MKHTVKYANGYISIDDENLYLTSTQNPDAALTLTEKTVATREADRRRARTNSIIIGVFFVVSMATVVYGVAKGALKFLPLLFVYFIIYKVIQHFMRQSGSRYKIPLSKIDAITPHENGLRITFRNEANQPDEEILKGVKDEDRQAFIEKLTAAILPSEAGSLSLRGTKQSQRC